MTSVPCVCPPMESPTLYISVISSVLLIVSEALGYYNRRNSAPTSLTEVAARVVRSAIKLATPPATPPSSVVEVSS